MARAEAEERLRAALGDDAHFRNGQYEAIEAVVARGRVLVVQQTGWGKSMVYFLATDLLRRRKSGPTVIISPLLSLMRNQLGAAAKGLNLAAATLNSSNTEEWEQILGELQADRIDLLLVTPERISAEEFVTNVLLRLPRGVGLLVVDEAHCISDWGHDFRSDYRRIVRLLQQLPENVPVLATTATANDRVVQDIVGQIPNLVVQRGPLTRESLRIQTIRLADQAERLAWLARHVPELPGSGIIYCLTVADTVRVASWLRSRGIDARPYSAELETDDRELFEQLLLRNEVKALVATVALGMGFDKPDLGFVVHYQRPGSAVSYYQQIGRAGRSLDTALCVLLHGKEDDDIQEYFIQQAFPTGEELEQVLGVIEGAPDGITERGIEAHLNMRSRRLKQCLKFLEVEQAVYREGGRYFRTAHPWVPDAERAEKVTATRRQELARMQAFLRSDSCLMQFIAQELDDPHAAKCGRCAVCAGAFLDSDVNREMVTEAIQFLRRDAVPIKPRARIFSGNGSMRPIPPAHRVEEGRALCWYGDAGWGELVRRGKYRDGKFAEDLVAASVDLLRTRWAPSPFPEWVTAVPSTRSGDLVPHFARRLADRLSLPFRDIIAKTRPTQPQKEMENSLHRIRNLDGAFSLKGALPVGPVLLVDDLVDSSWTFAIIGRMLRQAGSGPVYPFALARVAGDAS